ncbi:hypothetical protein [Sphaerisporangium dianthi]|uniref:Uncharacterized protein n=1 Tax=Sphaerisporangium dianthi TaxID=1436120 RepID=A0ABV9CPG7_9ACTN
METLLGELGKRISDRWVIRLVLPGLLWLVAAATAVVLGHARPFDAAALVQRAEQAGMALSARPVAAAAAVAAVLGAAVVAGLTAQALGRAVRAVWLGLWRGPAAPLGRRVRAWRLRRATARPPEGAAVPGRFLPARPTWIGDRFRLAGERVDAQYGLRLALVWIPLWQVLEEPIRTPVQEAADRFDETVRLAGWGALYAATGVLWWPGLPVGALVMVIAWRQGRAAAAGFADVVEATVDTRHRALAEALGVALPHGRLTRAEAAVINDLLHKGHRLP